jgi:hypothetical protein
MLWTGKWLLVILSLVLPILIVPLISMWLFPQVPLITSILGGVFASLLVAIGLRFIQSTKALGVRFAVAVVLLAVVVGLLLSVLPKLLS